MATAVGNDVTLPATFTDTTGALFDPSGLTLVITPPDNVPVTIPNGSLAHPSIGKWSYVYRTTQVGRYQWYYTAPGVDQPAVVFWTAALSTSLAIDMNDVKAQLNMAGAVTVDDNELRRLVLGAQALIEDRLGGPLIPTVFTETHISPGAAIKLNKRPVTAVSVFTPAALGQPSWNVSDLRISPDAAVIYLSFGQALAGAWTVTYTAGLTAVSDNIYQAVLETVQWLWESQRGQSATPTFAGGGVDSESPAFSTGLGGGALPSRINELLGSSVRPSALA